MMTAASSSLVHSRTLFEALSQRLVNGAVHQGIVDVLEAGIVIVIAIARERTGDVIEVEVGIATPTIVIEAVNVTDIITEIMIVIADAIKQWMALICILLYLPYFTVKHHDYHHNFFHYRGVSE